MKVVLAGAFGNLGAEILKALVKDGHEVIAADLKETIVEETEGKYRFVAIDATKPESLIGLCDGADAVITTVGLTGASTRFNSYDIDYRGNLNLLEEAKRAGIGKFVYISVISCDEKVAERVPMLHAKYMNWIAEGVNTVGQGALLAGVILLHKAGFADLRLRNGETA